MDKDKFMWGYDSTTDGDRGGPRGNSTYLESYIVTSINHFLNYVYLR